MLRVARVPPRRPRLAARRSDQRPFRAFVPSPVHTPSIRSSSALVPIAHAGRGRRCLRGVVVDRLMLHPAADTPPSDSSTLAAAAWPDAITCGIPTPS